MRSGVHNNTSMHIVWVQQFASLHCCHAGIFIAHKHGVCPKCCYVVMQLPKGCLHDMV